MKSFYELSIGTHLKQTISLPEDTIILSIRPEDDGVRLYTLIDLNDPFVSHTLYAFITGSGLVEESIENLLYIDTIPVHNGSYVVHYFIKV